MLRPARTRKPGEKGSTTRERLIEETSRVVEAQGVDAVEVDEILSAVGVSRGSLYHHFSSVNELIIEALVSTFAAGVDESILSLEGVLNDCSSVHDVSERLRAVTRETQQRPRAHQRMQRARILSLASTFEELSVRLAAEQRRMTTAITSMVADAQERGWFRPDLDARALAVLIQSYTLGRIVDDVVDDADKVDSNEWVRTVDHVVDGLLNWD